ncbi:cyclic AMP-responsive element-binding protein 3-like protein 3-A isoform X1 [Esox lucius]|uniref:cyclic AMP-responsive element-binding protein 3-like protein 3-A isoform X1 n=1 Tax=Esox lucius TaxID=8010 RepID=UPI0014770C6B|nr:cyclic AMP-responsive element-binding protein 3-like protein 3-A isoform X1 [Esox lucius]
MDFLDVQLNQTDRSLTCHGNQPWQIGSLNPVDDHDFLDTLLCGIESAPTSPLWTSSHSDSGISEDPTSDHLDSPNLPASPIFHAFCQPHRPNLHTHLTQSAPDFSIDLAGWESGLGHHSNGNSHKPRLSPGFPLTIKDLLLSGIKETQGSQNSLQELFLNEEEKRLLAKEGVHLPSQMPLTKYEERVLKKIRRKIRNKQSAQESRKKKREYVDSLEGRMEACSTHNLELQRKVHQLEEHNTSLLEQLARLQTLLPNGSSKTAQKGTCILILLLAFSLILSSSLQPDPHSAASQEGDFTVARARSRSLLAVTDTEIPVSSVARGWEVLSTLEGKLRLRPEHTDSESQTIHNHRL